MHIAKVYATGRAAATLFYVTAPLRRMAVVHAVDLLSREIHQRGEALVGSKKLRLEAPHLAGGSCSFRYGTTADNPAHGRVTSKSVGIIDILIAANRMAGFPATKTLEDYDFKFATTVTPCSARSALGHPDHLKTRLRPLPCSGRHLSAIWNCMCGSRHVRTYLARIA